MTDEDNSQGTDAAEAFEAMCVELALLRRAVEGLAAERGAIDFPDYTETLGRMQKGVDATADRIEAINDVIARSPALAMTPEQMAQRIVAAGNAARREDQAALARAGEDKARVMAELRAVAGSAWTRADQKNRQLWFGLGGVAIGIIAWAIVPGLVAREVAPASWQWPERMATRALAEATPWDAGQHLMASASRPSWEAIVAADRLLRDNREKIEGCRQTARKADQPVRCTIQVGAEK